MIWNDIKLLNCIDSLIQLKSFQEGTIFIIKANNYYP